MRISICPGRSARQLLIPLLLLSLAGPAAARTGQDARAERFYRQGMLRLDDGNFKGAISSFQAAYQIKPLARLQYLIGHAYRKLGQPASALRYYEEYRKTETDLTPDFEAELDQQIAELRDLAQRTGRLVTPPTPPEEGPPPAGASPVPPPAAAADPRPDLLPTGDKGPEQSPRLPLHRRWWFWTAIGAGAAAAIAIGAGVAAARPDPCRDILCR